VSLTSMRKKLSWFSRAAIEGVHSSVLVSSFAQTRAGGCPYYVCMGTLDALRLRQEGLC
jgi:hypothetical protein